ncbi:uncharacterized protein BJ171DRAFT_222055 [Polychytrium aggregatum]|uniref:uncharacterized protein n=1 Tax=Polychytrium aggregatum TaxID=110093 RepID=UPI0022FE11A2|nr:uncharacterized protein BJ171DRAFT_222055 [Polychytrium aggregatum]KAI9197521.1 hypothetical protein BJ171DRAFT_222055 [Polychytrium aggregatum]
MLVDWTIVICIIGGWGLAAGTSCTGNLGKVAQSGMFGSFWNFLSGGILVLFYWVFDFEGRSQGYDWIQNAPWWMWLGGIFGSSYVASATMLVPRLGASMVLGCSVLGQMVSSIIMDNFGVMGLHQRSATAGRIVGVVLTVGGVVAVVLATEWSNLKRMFSKETNAKAAAANADSDRDPNAQPVKVLSQSIKIEDPNDALVAAGQTLSDADVDADAEKAEQAQPVPKAAPHPQIPPILFIPAVINGVLISLQAASNGALGVAGSRSFASIFSYASGTAFMLLCALITTRFGRTLKFQTIRKASWWAWFGGAFGTVYVLSVLILTPHLGATTVLSGVVCGQISAALVLDHFALFGLPKRRISPMRIGGAVVLLAGVMMVAFL